MTKQAHSKETEEQLETSIVVEDDVEYPHPYCVIPRDYFARALQRSLEKKRKLLTIHTWDGREILSVDVEK